MKYSVGMLIVFKISMYEIQYPLSRILHYYCTKGRKGGRGRLLNTKELRLLNSVCIEYHTHVSKSVKDQCEENNVYIAFV